MKKLLIILSWFPLFAASQDVGIRFQKSLNWLEILAKAKAENKNVFIDCYATWCIPCKFMDDSIFTVAKVGDYFNQHFINIKIQFDSTLKDNEETKNWYVVAKEFAKQYKIGSFPTSLFFSNEGKLVNRFSGVNKDPEYLIAKAKEATEYSNSVKLFLKNSYDTTLIKKLAINALNIDDKEIASRVSKRYIELVGNVFDNYRLQFICKFIHSTEDTGFQILIQNSKIIDSLMGPGWSAFFIRPVISWSFIHPLIDSVKKEPKWNKIKKNSEKEFPGFGGGTLELVRMGYYQRKNDWKKFGKALAEYVNNYPLWVTNVFTLNTYADIVFQHCKEIRFLNAALKWAKKSIELDKHDWNLDTYANLLYKLGDTNQAILIQTEALSLNKGKNKIYKERLDKMKKGEKTWE